jgi:hypothetical protein
VVHAYPERVKTEAAKVKVQQDVQKWVEGRVSKHKFLRGGEFRVISISIADSVVETGVVIVDIIPKR